MHKIKMDRPLKMSLVVSVDAASQIAARDGVKQEYCEMSGLFSPEIYYYYDHRMLTATSRKATVSLDKIDKIYHRFSLDFCRLACFSWSRISPKNNTQLFLLHRLCRHL